jgi:hypothetical protein
VRSVVFVLLTKYYADDKVKRNEMCGEYGLYGERSGTCTVLVRKPERNRLVGKPSRRWVDNIRMYIEEIGCGIMYWIDLAQDRARWLSVGHAVMNVRVP